MVQSETPPPWEKQQVIPLNSILKETNTTIKQYLSKCSLKQCTISSTENTLNTLVPLNTAM